jgi:hypothetical protein
LLGLILTYACLFLAYRIDVWVMFICLTYCISTGVWNVLCTRCGQVCTCIVWLLQLN